MTQQEINAKLEQLVKDNLGKAVEKEDSSNLDQCFDWLLAYVDALGIPRSAVRHFRAYEIWTLANDETRKYFDLIPNSLTAVPKKGDVPIFDKTVGPSGHVCLASGNSDGTKSFQSTDQNWNGHLFIEYIWHNYNGCLGWLRPKSTSKDDSASNYYKGYDLTNKESMRIAVDILVRVQAGGLIDKSLLQAALDRVHELEKRPASCPPQKSFADQIKRIIDAANEIHDN